MGGDSPEAEDDLIDLNNEPVERKRKKNGNNILGDNGCERSDELLQQGRVLRSRTVAMSDGEKREIKLGIVIIVDKRVNEVSGLGGEDEDEMTDPQRNTRIERKRGRPRKAESKPETHTLTQTLKRKRGRPPKAQSGTEMKGILSKAQHGTEASSRTRQKKKRRGRPPKSESKHEVSNVSAPIKVKRGRTPQKQNKIVVSNLSYENSAMVHEKADENSNVNCDSRKNLKHKRLGRPPKILKGDIGSLTKKDDARICSGKLKSSNGGPRKKSKVGKNASEYSIMSLELGGAESAEGRELKRRQQKQLLRDSIVAMLKSAGWSVEYRQRQSKDYQDAVYVDREGRTYWSVTLAYRKFKEKIDFGNANDQDRLAYVPIPEETLSMLFRVGGRGKTTRKKSNLLSASKSSNSKKKSRCNVGKQRTLLARTPKDGLDSDGYELYDGKRSLLSWMIDLGTVPLNGKVKYTRVNCKKILLEGTTEKEGIRCDCCNILHTVRGFESHAGEPPGRPYQNIFLDSESSLSQCLLDSWKKHVEAGGIGFAYVDVDGDDPNDDTCNVCGDGGDLICCDSCTSTFHHGCLHINVPTGDWYCVYCSCKFCPTTRGISIGSNKLAECSMCEEKFHVDCAKDQAVEQGNLSFCGTACSKIFHQFQDLLGFRNEMEEGFSYTVLQYRPLIGDMSLDDDISSLEIDSKLAVAYTAMDECFQPIIDERSGANVIHNVVYSCGSNIKRLNYDKFFTIILEKGDELVSAASIRIHGSQLAEMPFIGTRYMYRRQGMCSRLLYAIEKVLSTLGIEKLVIPAIAELNDTWTKVFGFSPLEDSKRLEMRFMNMIAFPGVDMLQKPIIPHQCFDQKSNSDAIQQPKEMTIYQENVPEKCATGSDVPTNGTSYEKASHEEGDDDMQSINPSLNINFTTVNDSQCATIDPDNADNIDHSCEDNTSQYLISNASNDCKLEAQQVSPEETDVMPSENVESVYC